ncbi:hypothetical protein HKX48_009187, partial [Thoreauomyces humboldtii]
MGNVYHEGKVSRFFFCSEHAAAEARQDTLGLISHLYLLLLIRKEKGSAVPGEGIEALMTEARRLGDGLRKLASTLTQEEEGREPSTVAESTPRFLTYIQRRPWPEMRRSL